MADSLSLAGKTAIVTGSARDDGIGAAIARAFARNGAAVAIHHLSDASKPRAEQVAADIAKTYGVKTTVIQGAVEDQDVTVAMVEAVLKALDTDHVDILVNNAGAGAFESLLEIKPAEVQALFAANVIGSLFMTQAVVRAGHMPRGGRIINIGSVASRLGLANVAVYSAAKAAQDSLTSSWASELGRSHGITVNTLAPGPVLTTLSRFFLENADGTPSAGQEAMLAMTRAENRVAMPVDIADAALLVVSEKSRWITAQFISVSGGITGAI